VSRENPHLDQALKYAEHHWPVFALQPGTKIPLPGSHGVLEATTDERQILLWFERHPDRNVGVATGSPGPDVLDVDTKGARSNGYAAWNQLKRAGLTGNPQAIISTPSGGMHAVYRGTGQRNGKLTDHGLDFRAKGGYVVAVPSLVDGKRYGVVRSQASAATCDWSAIREHLEPQAERPEWQPRRGSGGVGHLADWVAGLNEGNRNDGLFWAANRAIEAGDKTALDAIAAAALAAGLHEREVSATIRSAQRHGRPKAERQREAG
jgi:Bifunctional DNA primase/polymerase, N-terminal